MLIPGVEQSQWQKAASLCREFDSFYYSAGIHPWWVDRIIGNGESLLPDIKSSMLAQAADEKCIAIGETGLDKMRLPEFEFEPAWRAQLTLLELHIQVAKELQLPLILHAVKAHAELLDLLIRHKPSATGVIHAFTGSYELAKQYWELGFYLGVGGTITYERAHKTRKAVERMPLDALLLETDAPSMPLAGKQGSDNSPENLPLIAKALAQLKKSNVSEIQKRTTENFRRLFQTSN